MTQENTSIIIDRILKGPFAEARGTKIKTSPETTKGQQSSAYVYTDGLVVLVIGPVLATQITPLRAVVGKFDTKKMILVVPREVYKKVAEQIAALVTPYSTFLTDYRKVRGTPPHRVMAADESKLLLRSTLPTILAHDPGVIWCGGKPGDIIEIRRTSEAIIVSRGYRVVI